MKSIFGLALGFCGSIWLLFVLGSIIYAVWEGHRLSGPDIIYWAVIVIFGILPGWFTLWLARRLLQ